MKMKKFTSLFVTVVICFGVIVACSNSDNSLDKDNEVIKASNNASEDKGKSVKDITDTKDNKKIITIGETSNFKGGFASIYGPEQGNSWSYYYYINNFYEPLVNYDNGVIKPGLAKKWDVSENGLVYTFYLNEGIKFSDGTDLTADVVKLNFDNFDSVLGKSAANYGLLNSYIKQFKVINDYEFEIHLSKPYYATLANLAMVMPRGIMAPAAYNEEGKLSDDISTHTYGTGPYMYQGDTDNHLSYKFVRNPHYNRELPEVDEFIVKVIEDNASKSLALQNGEVDILINTGNIAYDTFESLNKKDGIRGEVSDVNALTEFIALNSKNLPFDDVNVRQAIANALDRVKIADVLFEGLKTPAGTIMDTKLPYCDISVNPYTYDIEKSKKLLEQSGWKDSDGDGIREKDGIKLSAEIKYVVNDMNDKTMFAVKSNLKDIGMDIKLNGMEQMAMFADVYSAGEYEMCYYHSYGILYDPFTFVSNMNPNMDYNKDAYSTDPMVSKALASMDYNEAYELTGNILSLVGEDNITSAYHKALETAHNDAVVLPVTYRNEITIFNSNLINDYKFSGNPSWINITGIDFK